MFKEVFSSFKLLREKYPSLDQVDLVVEGAVGGNKHLAYALRQLFPGVFYVGTDLHPIMIPVNKSRLTGGSDATTFQRIREANQLDSLFPEGAWVCADCFDRPLVQDIMQRSRCQFPLLVSVDALPFLLSDINAGQLKSVADRHSVDDILSVNSPFAGFLHISSSRLWHDGGPRPGNEGYYYDFEEAADERGWITARLPNALVVLR